MNRLIPINFDWKYCSSFDPIFIEKDYDDTPFELVHIPHTNIELSYNNFNEKDHQFISCYRKHVGIETLAKDERVYINFGAVMAYAKVYLNGHCIGEHKGGYTPFRLDMTDYLPPGAENVIVVYVNATERNDIPPFGFVVDYLTYGGIYREVSLEYCHALHPEMIGIRPQKVLSDQPVVEMDLSLINEDHRTGEDEVEVTLKLDNQVCQTNTLTFNLVGLSKEFITLSQP